MFIHLIADYGNNDLAFNEVVHRLKYHYPGIDVMPLSVPPFSTLATGFAIAQLALFPIKDAAIYSNTAPRKDDKSARAKNRGEGFVYAKLKNGMCVMAVNSGYSFSFVKPEIESLHVVNVANDGSQFRSRDNYPQAVAELLRGNQDYIGPAIDPEIIPEVPQNKVAWVDGYGNIKTTIRQSEVNFKPGELIQIILNTTKLTAWYAAGTFEVHEGDLAFAPGSSGGEDRFMEIFLRGGSARRSFHKVRVEQSIEFRRFAGK